MNLTEFLARLSRGPLANLSMSNDGNGTIQAARIPALVGYINDVLLRLYTKFDLSEKELIIIQQLGISLYRLTPEHSTAVGTSDLKFIQDSVLAPYTGDLVKILGVYDSYGERPLNDQSHERSVFTPQYNTLQVPHGVVGNPMHIVYQAKHPTLTSTGLTASVELPDVLIEAALSYTASKVYAAMNGQENALQAAGHMETYKSVCAEVADRDLVSSSVSLVGVKFRDRGFV